MAMVLEVKYAGGDMNTARTAGWIDVVFWHLNDVPTITGTGVDQSVVYARTFVLQARYSWSGTRPTIAVFRTWLLTKLAECNAILGTAYTQAQVLRPTALIRGLNWAA